MFIAFVAVGSVNATDNLTDDVISVNDMGDELDDKLSVSEGDKLNYALNDGSFKDLSNDIGNAESELNLTRDYVFDSSIDSANAIIIDKSIVINGKGHNILAESKTSVFSITAKNVVLKNINFYDCSGGSILWQGLNGTLINCKFENCKNNGNGGAICWKNSNGLISNCIFKKCSSNYDGGALCLEGSKLKIEDCEFINNSASTYNGNGGGAIYLYYSGSSEINIDNCTFNHNTAVRGGAISGSNGVASKINNSKFYKNSNLAIYWYGNNFEINNSIFINNTNDVFRGFGPYAPINSEGNLGVRGGAVYISGDNTRIFNSIFNNNKVSASILSTVDKYKDTTFNQWNYNNIRQTFNLNAYGGALAINGNKFYLNNISCENNSAYSSGRVNIEYTAMTYDMVGINMYQYIYANSYGGAIYLNGGGILSNAFISGNKLDGFAQVNRGIVSASTCPTICEVKGYGVGVYWDGYSRNNLVNNSVFVNNELKSGQTGSALYLNNFKGDVNSNIFLQNPNLIIGSSGSEFTADYNWWGNTVSNFNQKLFEEELSISKWLFLNMSSDDSNLQIGDKVIVTLDLSNVYDSSSDTINHVYEMNNVDFNLVGNKIKTNVSNAIIKNGIANVEIVAQNYGQGSLTASYNGITSTLTFTISKKPSQVKSKINNCSIYKEELIAYFNVTPDATGTLKVYLNDNLHSTITLNGNNAFNIDLTGLNANNYTLYAVYDGDGNYSGSSATVEFEIKKAANTIHISNPYTIDYGNAINLNVDKGNVTDGTLNVQIKSKDNTLVYNQTHNIMDINKITLPVLDAGSYTLTINYESNNYYESSFDSTFTVNKLNPIINKQIINTVYGKSEIMFNSSVDGILKINILNNTCKTFNIKSNQDTSLNLSDINAGDYDIEFVFIPNNQNYNNATSRTTLTIFKSEPTFDIVAEDIEYKDSATLDITYLNDVTGFANITISNEEGFEIKYSNMELKGGNFNRIINNLNASEYTITFEYSGNNNYYPTSLSKSFNVLKIDPVMIVDVINAVYGQTAKITVNCNAEGNVNINIGSFKKYGNLLINDNRVVQNIYDIDAGTYDVTVEYGGNNNYNAKTENAKLTISKISSNVVATVDDITYSQDTVINVKSSVNGDVIVTIDGRNTKIAGVIANSVIPVTIDNPISVGKHNVSVKIHPSNNNYGESRFNTEYSVSKKETTVVLDVPSSVYGEDVVVNVTASEDGKIILKIDDITKEKTVFANTVTKINLGVLAAKTYDIIASFDAGDNYKSSNDENKIVVSPAEAKITEIQSNNNVYGENTIIDVKSNVEGILTVKINNAVKTFNIDANKLTSLDLGKYDANTYDIDLTLDAGANYTQATGSTKATVNPKQTIVSLDVNNEVYGNNVVVKVTASENGKVIVQVGSIVKSVEVEANKVASVDLGVLDVNSYEVIATFDGGENFNASSDKESFEISPKASAVTFVDLVNNYIYSNNVVVNVKSDTYGTLTVNIGDKTQTKQVTAEGIVSFDFGILDVNKYDIKVSLDVGNNYIPSQNTASITIAPKNTVVTLNTKEYDVDENVIVNVTASENGKVTLKLNNIVKTVDVIANKLSSVDFGILGSGSYDVIANFTAGSNYVGSSDTANIKVLTKIDENDIDITVPEIKPNQENNIVINLPADATGTVTLTIGNNSYTFNVKNGVADIKVPELSGGNYDYKINYSGDSKYSSFEKTDSITVAKPTPEIVIPPLDEPSADGSVTVNLPNDATGTVTLVINDKSYSFPVVNGVANVKLPELDGGNYDYTVTYSGDGKYSSFTTDGNMKVNNTKPEDTKTAPEIVIPPLDEPSEDGSVAVSLPGDATGTITLVINGKSYSFPVVNGVANVYMPDLSAKTYSYSITYSGDSKYDSFTNVGSITVTKKQVNITASSVTTVYNGGKYIVATLTDKDNNPMSDFDVTITINGKPSVITTDDNGQAKLSVNGIKPGVYVPTVVFSGSSKYLSATKSLKVTVKKATPKVTAAKKTFKRTLKTKKYTITLKTNQNKVMKNTKVYIKVNGKTYSAKTNSKGKATFKITKLTKKGKFNAVVTYKGNTYYNKVTKKVQITIK